MGWNRQRPSRCDPRLQLEQATLAAEAQEVIGVLVAWRLRAYYARFRWPVDGRWRHDGRWGNRACGGGLLVANPHGPVHEVVARHGKSSGRNEARRRRRLR